MKISASDLSVVIPLYNKSNTIKRAVMSVLKQPQSLSSIIIVDDGSTDKGGDIVRALARKYSNVRLISQKNQGVSVARNVGYYEAVTPYVCFLDADDYWLEHHIGSLLDLVNSNISADFFATSFKMIREGQGYDPIIPFHSGYDGLVPNFIVAYQKGYGIIHSSTVCFRKTFLEKTGGFPPGGGAGQDIYLWLLSGTMGRFAFLDSRSAIIERDDQTGRIRRAKYIPYYIQYFSDPINLAGIPHESEVRRFVQRKLIMHSLLSHLEGNSWMKKELQKISINLGAGVWIIVTLIRFLPRSMIRGGQKMRSKVRGMRQSGS